MCQVRCQVLIHERATVAALKGFKAQQEGVKET